MLHASLSRTIEEGINIAIHWQDADSSSSSAVTEHFPDADIMICGGHVGKAHKKQLEQLAKMKSFTDKYKKKHREKFPQVDSVVCHCEKQHTPGCGYLSIALIEKARNNFSFILSNVTDLGKPSVWDFFLKIEFDAWLISYTIELTRIQVLGRSLTLLCR